MYCLPGQGWLTLAISDSSFVAIDLDCLADVSHLASFITL